METQYIEFAGKDKKIRFRRSLFWDVPVSALDLLAEQEFELSWHEIKEFMDNTCEEYIRKIT